MSDNIPLDTDGIYKLLEKVQVERNFPPEQDYRLFQGGREFLPEQDVGLYHINGTSPPEQDFGLFQSGSGFIPDPQRFFEEAFYPASAPSQTDHSEFSAWYTDCGDTLPTWRTSIPGASSASQYGQDEDVSSSNATCVPDVSTDTFLTYDSNANLPRAPTIVLEAPSTPARLHPPSRPAPPLILPRTDMLTNRGGFANHSYPPPPQTQPTKGRSRTVRDPEKTTGMRGLVCIRCRSCKTVCDEKVGACGACKKWDAENHGRLCIRSTLEQILRTGGGEERWRSAWLDDGPRLDGSHTDIRDPRPIDVVFSDADPKPLRVYTYLNSGGQSQVLGTMAPSRPPSDKELLEWAKCLLRKRAEDDYRGAVDSFLVHFVAFGHPVKPSTGQLVNNVVTMSAMWHILNARMLFHRAGPPGTLQDVGEVVLVQIQQLAQRVIYAVEYDILKATDSFIPGTALEGEDIPAIWGIFWGLILLYRHTLASCQRVVAINGGFSNSNCLEASQPREGFAAVTSRLLDALIVIYSTRFRTSQVQDALNSSNAWIFRGDPRLGKSFEEAREAVFRFYDEVPKKEHGHDEIIAKHIIEWEGKVKSRKYRGKRRNCKKGVAGMI